ncbi:MAG: hypothetical protein K2X07_08265 [Caulobacteraceae bacterium]|nr:hypothetical protein [Caulobacteraceae bacterium]
MLFDPELTHEGERHSPFMAFGVADDAPLPATDWVQTLLDHRAVGNLERFMEVDDPRPEMPLLIAFDSEDLKARDGFVLFGIEGEDPFEGLPDGGEVDDITVPGNPNYDDPYDDWWETGGSAGGEGGGPGGDGGSGGGEGPTVPQDPGHAGEGCALNAIRDEINGEPTNDSSEHSAAVYRGADGRYYTTPVFTGSSGSAPVDQLIVWLIENGIPFSQITSVYHNHDSAGGASNPNEIAVNQYPSHLFAANGIGDWFMAGLFVNPPSQLGQVAGADPLVFRMVVEDTAGTARAFRYQDRQFYEALSLQDMLNGVGLPAPVGGCGSSQ